MRTFLLAALLSASCAADAASAKSDGGDDTAKIREMLDLAGAGPAENLRPRLEAIAGQIEDRELRDKSVKALPALVDAAALRRRITDLDTEMKGLNGIVAVEAGGPEWMRARVGDRPMQVFDRLVTLGLNDKTNPHFKDYKLNTRVNDAWLERLAGLPHLRSLDIANTDVRGPGLRFVGTLRALDSINLTLTPISDDALEALSGLSELRVLGLASTKVTGTGMSQLDGLKKLENLNCHSTPVTDAGLEKIGKVASLKRLEIVHTQFTDAGLPALSGLVQMERLQLGSRKATGAGLGFLKDMTRLRELDVHDGLLSLEGFRNVAAAKSLRVLRAYGGTGGDEGLAAIAELSELETLILEGIGLTDAGLETLAKFPRLKKVTLHESKVTDAALARFRTARPAVDISR